MKQEIYRQCLEKRYLQLRLFTSKPNNQKPIKYNGFRLTIFSFPLKSLE